MRRLLLLILVFCVLGFYVAIKNLSYPRLMLGRLPIGFKTRNEIQKTLENSLEQTISVKVYNRIYNFRYRDLGIILNQTATLDMIFAVNHQVFPINIISFVKNLLTGSQLLPRLSFGQNYYHFVTKTIFDFTNKPDTLIIDDVAKKIDLTQNDNQYQIDGNDLKAQLFSRFGEKSLIIEPQLTRLNDGSKFQKITTYNQQLKTAFEQPLHLVINNNNALQSYTVDPADLKQLVNIGYDPNSEQINLTVNNTAFDRLIFSALASGFTADRQINPTVIKNDIIDAISARLNGTDYGVITEQVLNHSNTSGEKADRYIEIDISQQTLYLFDQQNLAGIYRISSGLYKPTPRGEFKIINKATNAYSDLYHVFMPYWMAFYFEKETNSYYGIHELPYWITGNGQKIQRPREFIGAPHTGGCVSLDIGAAKQVYDFSSVDMPVFVFD